MSANDFFLGRCPHCNQRLQVATEPQQVALQLLCMEMASACDWPAGSGQHIDAKHFKQLLILAYERYHEREARVLPALDGEGWDCVYRRSSRLEKGEASEVLAMGNVWLAERGVLRPLSWRERLLEKTEALDGADQT